MRKLYAKRRRKKATEKLAIFHQLTGSGTKRKDEREAERKALKSGKEKWRAGKKETDGTKLRKDPSVLNIRQSIEGSENTGGIER